MAAPDPPAPYQVVYSDAVEQRLEELSDAAFARGDGPAFTSALETFRARLAVFPQFGEPLYDLIAESGQIYTGVIPPITMRYGVFEDRRMVFVVAMPLLMRKTKPDAGPG